jgi:hypothetical protein
VVTGSCRLHFSPWHAGDVYTDVLDMLRGLGGSGLLDSLPAAFRALAQRVPTSEELLQQAGTTHGGLQGRAAGVAAGCVSAAEAGAQKVLASVLPSGATATGQPR